MPFCHLKFYFFIRYLFNFWIQFTQKKKRNTWWIFRIEKSLEHRRRCDLMKAEILFVPLMIISCKTLTNITSTHDKKDIIIVRNNYWIEEKKNNSSEANVQIKSSWYTYNHKRRKLFSALLYKHFLCLVVLLLVS